MEAVVVHKVSKKFLQPNRSGGLPAGVRLPGMVDASMRNFALQEISLQIEAGEVFGFLGPPKAGKTTLLRLLAGMLNPDSGYIEVFGCDSVNQVGSNQNLVNPVGLDTGVLERFSPLENLVFSARLSGSHDTDTCLNARKLLAGLGIDHKMAETAILDLPVSARRKTALVRAMMSPANLLLLDDPLTGLDQDDRMQALLVIKTHNHQTQRTTVLSGQVAEDIQSICDRHIVLDSGCLVSMGVKDQQLAAI